MRPSIIIPRLGHVYVSASTFSSRRGNLHRPLQISYSGLLSFSTSSHQEQLSILLRWKHWKMEMLPSYFSKIKQSFYGSPATSSVVAKDHQKSTSADVNDAAKPTAASINALWMILQPEKQRLKAALAALAVSSTAQIAFPFLLGRMVDAFKSPEAAIQLVNSQFLLCSSFVFLWSLATMVRLFLLESSIERIALRLRSSFFRTVMNQEMHFFDKHLTGALINRLSGDVTVTSRVLIEISAAIRCLLNTLGGCMMLFYLAPASLLTIFLIPIVLSFSGGFFYGRVLRKFSSMKQTSLAELIQHAEERISNIRTVRMFNGEAYEQSLFDKNLNTVYSIAFRNVLAVSGGAGGITLLAGSFLIYIIYYSGLLISSGALSMGTLSSLLLYCLFAGRGIQGLFAAYGDIQRALGACDKVVSIIHPEEEMHSKSTSPPIALSSLSSPTNFSSKEDSSMAEMPKEIRFEDVW
ncbi:ABC transporter transmembrane region domain-containing protein, partial [Cardiosporidium cionae]